MSLQDISPDPWIGKLVWFFPRDDRGLQRTLVPIVGFVIDKIDEGIYIIMHEDQRIHAWVRDMEEMEDFDE